MNQSFLEWIIVGVALECGWTISRVLRRVFNHAVDKFLGLKR